MTAVMTALPAWNPDTLPRERLLAATASRLGDDELLALLIGSGRPGKNALEIARELLASWGGLRGIGEASAAELVATGGIGEARAAAIEAAIELGRRVVGTRPLRGGRLGDPNEVWRHFQARLGSVPVEEFWVLGLDVRHRLLFELCAARGCLTGVEVHPRDIFHTLIRRSAAAAIFCHNHPSGDPSPSRQDLELTARLREVGELCGIAVLDHVAIAAEGYVSLAERRWL
jgi:DNA repair protein RadC